MNNNIHAKVFTCPKCTNLALYPVNGNNNVIGIGYHDLCVCDECGAELYAEPQHDYTVKFVDYHYPSLEDDMDWVLGMDEYDELYPAAPIEL